MDTVKNIPKFSLSLRVGYRDYIMLVEQYYVSDQIEKFRITGRKNSFICVQSNRPFLRLKQLRHRQIKWQLIEGKVTNASAFSMLLTRMEEHIKFIENPPFDWKNHPKNDRTGWLN